MNHEELGRALRDAAYLEGDFLLRSGRRSRYYLDKYRFETRPGLLGPLGQAIAAAVQEHEPNAVRLAGPELGAVALAASASLAGGLPFLIVRGKAKEYGTANRLEGVYEEGECVCPSTLPRRSARGGRRAQSGSPGLTVLGVDREEGRQMPPARSALYAYTVPDLLNSLQIGFAGDIRLP